MAETMVCTGDCNDDGVVRVNEVIRMVKALQALSCPIAPHCSPPDPCLGLDVDGDGAVSVNELTAGVANIVGAVDNGLAGCPD
jgi:hypothetical protein